MGLKHFRWRSLKTRITLFTLVIFLSSIWVLAFYVGGKLRDDMQRLLGKQQFSTASFRAIEVNRELGERLGALGKIAGMLDTEIMDNPAALLEFFESRPIILIQFNAGVTILGPDGTAVAGFPAEPGRTGANYMAVDTVAAVLNDGKSTIGTPVMDKQLQAPVFNMTVPIRDGQGNVIGALAGTTDLSKPNFLDQITESYYGKSGYYLIVEAKSRLIVTGTGRGRIMQPLSPPGENPLFDRFVLGNDETGITQSTPGEEVLASARRINMADWFIIAALPTEEAFALIQDMKKHLLLATLLLTLLAGGLTWWMLRRELAPMLSAVRMLATLSDADQPPQPLPIASQDEIGKLIGGFNHLLETLGQRETALQNTLSFQQALMDAVPSPIFYKDADGVYIGSNKAFERYIGKTREQIIGKTVYDISPPDLAERYASADRELINNPGVQTYEASVVYADGTRHDVVFNKATFTDSAGRVAGQIGVILDITERKLAEEQIRQLAFFDQLTGLPNRRLLNDRLGQSMSASKRSGCFGALMFLDLDNFKPLNDTHGHEVGDLLLIEVANRLKRCVRAMDTVSRFGGDEFVVMLNDLSADQSDATTQAEIVAEKIRTALSEPYVLTVAHEGKAPVTVEHHCTVSIGVTTLIDHEASQDDILKWADTAMYQAKEAGRNLVRFYTGEA